MQRVEGQTEGAQRVASEQDGRALLGAREEVGRDAAQDERADVDCGRAYPLRLDAPASEVAHAGATPAVRDDDSQRPRSLFVDSQPEAGACVEQRAPSACKHDEGAAAHTDGITQLMIRTAILDLARRRRNRSDSG